MMEHTQDRLRANFHWVTDDLATGGDLHANEGLAIQQIKHLVEEGVTHIIDLRGEWSDEALVATYAPSITYLHLPSDDASGYHIPAATFDRGVEFARDAQASGGRVLAHCHMGINRGPSMAMAILLDRGMTPVDAFNLIRDKRDFAGVAYAGDAVAAHIDRTGGDPMVLEEFLDFEAAVWTYEERTRINRIIRRLHQEPWHGDPGTDIYRGLRA